MLKQEINKFFLFTFISMLVTYSLYHLTHFSIGHSLFLFAFLQVLSFSVIIYQLDRKKKKNIDHLYGLISGAQREDSQEFLSEQTDDDFNLVSRSLLDLKQKFTEDTYIYRHAQLRFLHILQNISSAVILLDKEGKIQFMNTSCEQLFQVSRLEALTKSHWKIGRETGLSLLIEEVRKNGKMINTEIILNSPFSKILGTTISPTTSTNRKDEEIVVVMHDMTERGKLDRLRKEFVANVSHELKTPLTSIKGFTETLLDGALENKEVTERFLKIIFRESDRLQEMVDSLLDLSVIESKKIEMTQVNIVEIVEEAVEEMRIVAEEKEIEVLLQVRSDNVSMLAEKYRLKQVMINLLSNSIKYSNPNSKVWVNVRETLSDIQIVVVDQGLGISSEHMERIFERFYRVDSSRDKKTGGRGIGLSIVKQIVKQHGGHIYLKSTINLGTTVTVLFDKKQ